MVPQNIHALVPGTWERNSTDIVKVKDLQTGEYPELSGGGQIQLFEPLKAENFLWLKVEEMQQQEKSKI